MKEVKEELTKTKDENKTEKHSLFQRICFDIFEFIGIVISLAALSVATLAIVLNNNDIPLNFLKSTLEEALGNPQKNISVEIGSLSLQWPDIRSPLIFRTEDINAKHGESSSFFSIKETQIQLHFLELLQGNIAIESVRLYKPSLRVIHLGNQEFVLSFAQEPYEIDEDVEMEAAPETKVVIAEEGESAQAEKQQEATEIESANIEEEETEETESSHSAILDTLIRNLLNNPEALPQSYRDIRRIEMEDSSIQVTDFHSGRTLRLEPVDIKLDRTSKRIKGEFLAQLPEDYGAEASIVLIAQQEKGSNVTDIQLSLEKTKVSTILKEWLPSEQVNEVIEDMQFHLAGTVEAKLNNFSTLQSLTFALQSNDLNIYTIKDKELVLKGGYTHTEASQSLVLDAFNLDQIKASAEVNFKEAKDDKAAINIIAEIDDLDTEILDQYWTPRTDGLPKRLSRLWLVEKIEEGAFKDLGASIQLKGTRKKSKPAGELEGPAEDKDVKPIEVTDNPIGKISAYDWALNWDNFYASMKFEDISVSYADSLPPAVNVFGGGEMQGKSLNLNVDKAMVDGLTVKPGGKLHFSDLVTKGSGDAQINLSMAGAVPDLFNSLKNDPINISKYVDLAFDQTKGSAEVDVDIQFPTVRDLKSEDFKVATKGVFKDLYVPKIINGLDLAGGLFDIVTSRKDFTLKGEGSLGDTSMTVDWHNYIRPVAGRPYQSRIQARTRATDELREAFNVDFREYIPDPIPVDVTYITKDEGPKQLSFIGDLEETDFEIRLLNYMKPKGNNGSLRFDAALEDGVLQSISRLELDGPSLDIKATDLKFIPGNTIPRMAKVSQFQVGKTKGEVVFRNENLNPTERLKIDVDALSVDASNLINKDKGGLAGDLPALVVRLKSKTLLLKNDEPLSDVELLFKQGEKGDIENVSISSIVGEAPLEVRFRPDRPEVEERLIFEAGNAGAALRALGLFKTIKGGTVSLTAIPVPDGLPQEVQGRLYISNFTITDTPFIAKLVNSLSVEGIVNLLENKDLSFTQFKANIRTQKAEDGDWKVIFKDAKTKGTSLGIAFDGQTNIDQKTLDINGQIIPASGLNKAIGQIPILGQILSGGDDAVFAANFSIKGPDTNPKVTVNPLSALTPGFLRKFLFED